MIITLICVALVVGYNLFFNQRRRVAAPFLQTILNARHKFKLVISIVLGVVLWILVSLVSFIL